MPGSIPIRTLSLSVSTSSTWEPPSAGATLTPTCPGEPLPTLAKRQGYGEILAYPYYGEGIGAINSGMIVRRDFVEKNPERVMEMLRAHRKATEQCMSDKAFWLETSSKMFGVELAGEEEIAAYARRLQERGARNVLVSMAGDGALLVTEDGQVLRQGVAEGVVKNSVGAGDSMVAGFLAGYLETGDYGYALKLGTACGGATAFSDGIGTKDEIMRLLATL